MLSDRELEVLKLMTQGLNNKEIAEQMTLSPHTVKAHLCSIFHKLNVTGRVQAVIAAIKFKLIQP